MPRPPTALILGGGIGGVAVARRLRRRLPRDHRVVLVDRSGEFTLAASLLWVMSGARRVEEISRPRERLRRRGIEVIQGDIETVDAERRAARVDGQTLTGEHLVIALGAEDSTAHIPGLAEHGFTYATPPGATALAERLRRIDAGRILITTAAPLYKCPAAPYEAAMLIDDTLRRRGVRDRVELVMHAAEPAPMGVAGPNVSAAVTAMLSERGIGYTPDHQVAGAEPGIAHYADGGSVNADLIVYTPGIAPPSVLTDTGVSGPSGWISVDARTLATASERVWAVGDNNHITLASGKPLPRAGVFAHRQALAVADRISAAVDGKRNDATFDGHGACFIEAGRGRAGYGSGNFYAEPSPTVSVRPPARRYHASKVLFEQLVMRRWL